VTWQCFLFDVGRVKRSVPVRRVAPLTDTSLRSFTRPTLSRFARNDGVSLACAVIDNKSTAIKNPAGTNCHAGFVRLPATTTYLDSTLHYAAPTISPITGTGTRVREPTVTCHGSYHPDSATPHEIRNGVLPGPTKSSLGSAMAVGNASAAEFLPFAAR